MDYLDESKNQHHQESSKQKRAKKVEVVAPSRSPECVQSETNHRYCCENSSFQSDFSCLKEYMAQSNIKSFWMRNEKNAYEILYSYKLKVYI